MHVFPRRGQDSEQQSVDEAECHDWAAERTGTDPFTLSRQSADQAAATQAAMGQAQTAGQGATGRAAAQQALAERSE